MKRKQKDIGHLRKELFVELLERHKRLIYKVVNSYCKDAEDQKDLEQDIAVQLWKAFDSYNSEYRQSTWVYRIALNVSISFYRRQKTRRTQFKLGAEEGLFSYAQEGLGYNAELEEKIGLLHRFIGELEALDKALMLLYLDEL